MSDAGAPIPDAPTPLPWHERWRNGIRLGETAVVIGLWATGFSAADPVIAAVLLTLGLCVACVAVIADPDRSRKWKAALVAGLVVIFAGSGVIVHMRQPKQERQINEDSLAAKTAAILRPFLPSPSSTPQVTGPTAAAPPPPTFRGAPSSGEALAKSPGGNIRLFVDCSLAPPKVAFPPDGNIHLMIIETDVIDVGAVYEHGVNVPGETITMPGERPAQRCAITNYGSETALNLKVQFRQLFQRALNIPGGGQKSGDTVLEKPTTMEVTKIDPGPQSSYVFYVFSMGKLFSRVYFPGTVDFKTIDGTAHHAPLMNADRQHLFFAPTPN
jgi:hypothetical protein